MRILHSLLDSLEPSSTENSSSSPAQSSTSPPATPSYSQPAASAPNTSSSSAAPPGSSFNWSDFKPFGDREWSTKKIIGRATSNLTWCFGLPIAVRAHTARDICIYDDDSCLTIESDETLKFSTFLEEEVSARDNLPTAWNHRKKSSTPEGTNSHQRVSRLARELGTSLLTLRTVVVQFSVGGCLHSPDPAQEDESSVFELLDKNGTCVREIWTTLKNARKNSGRNLEFLTVSWGLSLSVAKIAEENIPKWLVSAGKLPESETFNSWSPTLEYLFEKQSKKGLSGRYGQEPRAELNHPSVLSFFKEVLNAKKGEAQPRSLWSTVNLLLVSFKGGMAQREGVGRVMFTPWLAAALPRIKPEEIAIG